ncbi:MAG TPA: hypothetical protein VGH78_04190 [Solirubrobacteraceae bacterium]
MSRSFAILEAELDGEIAIRRRHAGSGSPQRAETGAGPRAAIETPAPVPPARPRVGEFDRIEDYLRSYLEDERFRSTHPLACGRWIVSWEMLWCADSRARVIAVGKRAREAMQAFGGSLLEARAPLPLDPKWPELLTERVPRGEPHGDAIAGVAGVVRACGEQLGYERCALLSCLFEHWRALAENVRRHEPGHWPAAERLRWEDGRRLVLLTALVMVEVDRSFA